MSGSLDSGLPAFSPDPATVRAFVERWRVSEASEIQNTQPFLSELCDLLAVARPDPATGDPERDLYCFERPVRLAKDEHRTIGRMDLYKAGHFVLEAKQGSEKGRRKGTAKRRSPNWTIAMTEAYGQALGYAQQLDTTPPFLVVVDVGYAFDLYANFDGSGIYRPFPDPPSQRFFLTDLIERPGTLTRLRTLFIDPYALDPSRRQAKVTREIAEKLAELALDLEATSRYSAEVVARFLMRCIFAMFAEDVGLFPKRRRLFQEYIEKFWIPNPAGFAGGVQQFFSTMNTGGTLLTGEALYRFNGGLFADARGLNLNDKQLRTLLEAAKKDWADVEPAIFGTLLERALDSKERHALGAHYTPRAYVERLVRPTMEVPLRAEWLLVQAETKQLVDTGKVDKAIETLDAFHRRLCHVVVLDPACGSGNFLYVALDLLKELESEVLTQMVRLGASNERLDLAGASVNPSQFRGIEKKPWAKEIAELVLWIGHLRWHHRLKGHAAPPPDPVLQDYHNVERCDAVLEWDGEPLPRKDAKGKPVTRWDGETMRVDPVTGNEVPDEKAQVPVFDYKNPRAVKWPKADFIVGNPPFIGNKRMRIALGDGYVEALRMAHDDVPETADYVMYWWSQAAKLVRAGTTKRFGLITTNSITQTFNRKVVAAALDSSRPMSIVFAIADHPWVDSESAAAVRIAMTVAEAGTIGGAIAKISGGNSGTESALVTEQVVRVAADLTSGTTSAVIALKSNVDLCLQGCKLVGDGFLIDHAQRTKLIAACPDPDRFMPRYIAGRDITARPQGRFVIDFFGCDEMVARSEFAGGYQIVRDHVKPTRDQNARKIRREKWWLFGENAPKLRRAISGLPRFIGTSEVARHRVFVWIELPGAIPDGSLAAIATSDAFVLGVLSSHIHTNWALKAGGTLEDRPRYQNGPCFDPFPFPAATDVQKRTIGAMANRLDAHRKRQLAAHPKLTITAIYNVLQKLRTAEPLDDKDREIHDEGLVTVLSELHDDLDRAVFDAYGWPRDLSEAQVLERLVALNQERAAEETRGVVRWLRPDLQAPQEQTAVQQAIVEHEEDTEEKIAKSAVKTKAAAWPKTFFERAASIRDLVLGNSDKEWSAVQVARSFTRAKTIDVEAILDSFAALGQLIIIDEAGMRRYRRAARR